MKPAPENFADILIEDFEPNQEPVKAPTYGNATTGEIYKPSNWTPARGESAEAALRIPSRGVSC